MSNPFNKILLFVCICIVTGIFSCKKEHALATDIGYDYFPVNIGHWISYNVDSVAYDFKIGYHDSLSYQIKEYFESDFIDNSGRNAKRIERYFRYNDTLNWTIKDVWYANLSTSTAEKVEENARYIKLVFPIREYKTWNGDAYNIGDSPNIGDTYNNNGQDTYRYLNVDMPYTINNMIFDSTVTVIQKEYYEDILKKYYKVEVYAKHVGLIYKKVIDYKYKKNYGDSIKKLGIEYSYTINSYGN